MRNGVDQGLVAHPTEAKLEAPALEIGSVCVYCGASKGLDPAFAEAASAVGAALARNRIGLVYGGGGLGLMGEVARAALAAGGHVTGVIPDFLTGLEHALVEADEILVTTTMHERKRIMYEKSDAFVALPGGIGTLEELVEQMTWSQIGQHRKPIVLLNTLNYWDPLLELFEHMRANGFIRPNLDISLGVADDPSSIVEALRDQAARLRALPPVDLKRDLTRDM